MSVIDMDDYRRIKGKPVTPLSLLFRAEAVLMNLPDDNKPVALLNDIKQYKETISQQPTPMG